MSFVSYIGAANAYRAIASDQSSTPVIGSQPGAPAAGQQVANHFGSVFHSTFFTSMATVFERGISGEFDDRTIALAEQAAIQRLRIAQQSAGQPAQPGATTTVAGANAAPSPVVAGGPSAASSAAVAEQRELYELRVRQSEARLANISSSLAQDFPQAASLASASTGTWDPATFVPRTREDVEAFAQRMVIDATEGAARLEIVKTQLDAARFEVSQGRGGPELQRHVADLEAAYARQQQYVDKLAGIVDEQSGGQVADVGSEALQGQTMREAGDISVDELADGLRASGMSEEQVELVIGAGELAVEQEKTPGGSVRLKQVASDMTTSLLARFNEKQREHHEEFQKQEEARAERRRADDRHFDRRRLDQSQTEHQVAQSQQRQQLSEQAQSQRSAQRHAEHQQWMATIAAAKRPARDAG